MKSIEMMTYKEAIKKHSKKMLKTRLFSLMLFVFGLIYVEAIQGINDALIGYFMILMSVYSFITKEAIF